MTAAFGYSKTIFDFGDGNGPIPAARHINPDGSVGGWVSNTARVSVDAHVSEDACVFGDAHVFGKARVLQYARVFGKACVSGNVCVYGNASVFGDAIVSGDACVFGNSCVYGNASVSGDACVFGDAEVDGFLIASTRSDGYVFFLLPQKDGSYRITAGCHGPWTIDESRAHWTATRAGTRLGVESFAILDFFEAMIAACAAP